MTYTVCVNAPGCLPVSDAYPYTVEDFDAARDALHEEIGNTTVAHDLAQDAVWAAAHDYADAECANGSRTSVVVHFGGYAHEIALKEAS